MEQPRKITNFISKQISDRMKPFQPSFTIPASSLSMLANFHKIPIQVGQILKVRQNFFLGLYI